MKGRGKFKKDQLFLLNLIILWRFLFLQQFLRVSQEDLQKFYDSSFAVNWWNKIWFLEYDFFYSSILITFDENFSNKRRLNSKFYEFTV